MCVEWTRISVNEAYLLDHDRKGGRVHCADLLEAAREHAIEAWWGRRGDGARYAEGIGAELAYMRRLDANTVILDEMERLHHRAIRLELDFGLTAF